MARSRLPKKCRFSTRREFLNLAAVGVAAAGLASMPLAYAAERSKIKSIAFDAFPIFNSRSLFALAGQLFPGKGVELISGCKT